MELKIQPAGVAHVLNFLNKNKSVYAYTITNTNAGRYTLARVNDCVSAIMLKKAWFMSFGTIATSKQWRDKDNNIEKGIGDSLNKEDLKQFLQSHVKTLYIVHSSGAIYSISLIDFLVNSHDYINDEGKEVKSINICNYIRIN